MLGWMYTHKRVCYFYFLSPAVSLYAVSLAGCIYRLIVTVHTETEIWIHKVLSCDYTHRATEEQSWLLSKMKNTLLRLKKPTAVKNWQTQIWRKIWRADIFDDLNLPHRRLGLVDLFLNFSVACSQHHSPLIFNHTFAEFIDL